MPQKFDNKTSVVKVGRKMISLCTLIGLLTHVLTFSNQGFFTQAAVLSQWTPSGRSLGNNSNESWILPWSVIQQRYGKIASFLIPKDTMLADNINSWNLLEGKGMTISANKGNVYAFGDYFNKRQANLFFVALSSTGSLNLCVASLDSKEKDFVTQYSFELPQHIQSVEGLIPLDMNSDGLLDVVIVYTSRNKKPWFFSNESHLEFLLLIQKSLILEKTWDSFLYEAVDTLYKDSSHLLTHPFLVDINVDGFPDVLVDLKLEKKAYQVEEYEIYTTRCAFINQQGTGFKLVLLSDDYFKPFLYGEKRLFNEHRLSNPHSSAFVDINGDCIPDIVFDVMAPDGSRLLEVWVARRGLMKHSVPKNVQTNAALLPKNVDFVSNVSETLTKDKLYERPFYMYSPDLTFVLPKYAHQISFLDINGDGTIDLIFPLCGQQGVNDFSCTLGDISDSLGVALNRQPELCDTFLSGSSETSCRLSEEMCQEKSVFWNMSLISLASIARSSNTHENYHFMGSSRFPITIQFGDFDADGAPDLLFSAQSKTGTSVLLLVKTSFSQTQTVSFNIAHVFSSASVDVLFQQYAFYDIEENGILDVIALGVSAQSRWMTLENEKHFFIFQQQRWDDPLYLKLSGVNGLNCSLIHSRCRGLGSVSMGASMTLVGYDLNGKRFLYSAVLLPRSAYSPLLLPYIYIGLGYVNNYIDYFYYGTPLIGKPIEEEISKQLTHVPSAFTNLASQHVRRWISLIPKCFVTAYPYPHHMPNLWILQLSVKPSNMFWTIFMVVFTVLLLLGGIIWYLDYQEKLEDIKEHQGFKKHFLTTI